MKVPPDCTRVKGKITRKPSMAVQPQSTSAVPPPPSVSPVGTIRSNRSNTSASSSSASLQPPIYNAATKPRSPTSPAPKPAKVKQVTATALYAYDAETDEELPLKEGDVLTVIQKDGKDRERIGKKGGMKGGGAPRTWVYGLSKRAVLGFWQAQEKSLIFLCTSHLTHYPSAQTGRVGSKYVCFSWMLISFSMVFVLAHWTHPVHSTCYRRG